MAEVESVDAMDAKRLHAVLVFREHLDSLVGESGVSALEQACWDHARSVAVCTARVGGKMNTYDHDLVDAAYLQTCANALANLTTDPTMANGNEYLRGAITSGQVDAAAVPKMTANELSPATHAPAQTRCTPSADARATDAFECPRCTQRKCTHYEMQTRSADEATTLFVTCVACGHMWTE
jgi:transcription elongation factor S-II